METQSTKKAYQPHLGLKTTIAEGYPYVIYTGLRKGYTTDTYGVGSAIRRIQKWSQKNRICVSIKKVEYCYSNPHQDIEGGEEGLEITFINYPRFPVKDTMYIQQKAEQFIQEICLQEFGQFRVTMVHGQTNIMYELS